MEDSTSGAVGGWRLDQAVAGWRGCCRCPPSGWFGFCRRVHAHRRIFARRGWRWCRYLCRCASASRRSNCAGDGYRNSHEIRPHSGVGADGARCQFAATNSLANRAQSRLLQWWSDSAHRTVCMETTPMPWGEIVPLLLTSVLAAIPVALPATFTLATALGARSLAKLGMLPTRLSAVDEAATIVTYSARIRRELLPATSFQCDERSTDAWIQRGTRSRVCGVGELDGGRTQLTKRSDQLPRTSPPPICQSDSLRSLRSSPEDL